jgi:hypothetical protein
MMLYSGREQTPRMGDPARAGAEERRAFPRRIDCDDTGASRRAVNPIATDRTRSAYQAQPVRRRLDID